MIKQLSKISVFTILIILGLSLNIYSDEPLDSDNDGMPDSWEITYGLNPSINDADNDADNDSLSNIKEFQYNTFPNDPDTDNDGLLDGEEIFEIDQEFKANTSEFIPSSYSNVSSNGQNYFIIFECFDPDGDDYGVFGQLFDNEGNKIGSEFQINTYTTGTQYHPSITNNGQNYFVSWQSYEDEGDNDGITTDNYCIFGQIFDNEGNKIGQEFQINTYTTTWYGVTDIASNGMNYFVLWSGLGQNGYGDYGQIIDNSGNKIGSEFQINAHFLPSLASNGKNYCITWTKYHQNENIYRVYAQIFDNDGNETGSEFPIATYTNSHTAHDIYYSDIASDGENYLIIWQTEGPNIDGYYAYGQLIDNDGNKIGSEFQVNSNKFYYKSCFEITGNKDNYFVVWMSWEQDGDDYGIFGQLLDNAGNKIGLEYQINSYTYWGQLDPTITTNGTNFCVTWVGSSFGFNVSGIIIENPGSRTNPLLYDTDNDGLSDGEELTNLEYQTNPHIPDTDDDGLIDGFEISNNLNPLVDDSTIDNDNDGLSNTAEFINGTLPNDSDTDNDGLLDGEEILNYNTDPLDIDSDNDGLIDSDEVLFYHSNPNNPDTDNDGMPDLWEATYSLNINVNDSDNDSDNDLLSNIKELQLNTSPSNSDTDNDGLLDGEEIFQMGEEIQINTYTTSAQFYPSIASNGNNYFIAWVSDGQDGESYGLTGQFFDLNGNKIGTEFQINTYTTMWQFAPKIASNGNNYFVTWQSFGQDGDLWGIYGQLYDSSGNKINSELRINSYTTGWQNLPSVASNGDTYFVVWQSQDDRGLGLYGQLFDNEGYRIGTEFQFSDSSGAPNIESNGENYSVVWDNYDIYAQFFDNEGNIIGDRIQVNTNTEIYQDRARITTTWENNYLIIWQYNPSSATIEIHGQLLNSVGKKLGQEFLIHIYYENEFYLGDIINNGHLSYMTWSWDGLDGDSFGVSSQFLDNNGKKAGFEFQLNNYTVNSQTYAILATAGTNFFAVWESEGQDGDIRGIYGKLITGYGTDPLISDTDNDGLRDGNEVHDLDIDPLNPDSDDDGMNDGDEVYVGMEPDNADSLFALQNITLHDDLNCATINWFGSIASPDIEYKILWSDYPWSQWNEVELDNGDIENDDGIRLWIDEGDNDAVPPRPQPTNSTNRFYKVIVE